MNVKRRSHLSCSGCRTSITQPSLHFPPSIYSRTAIPLNEKQDVHVIYDIYTHRDSCVYQTNSWTGRPVDASASQTQTDTLHSRLQPSAADDDSDDHALTVQWDWTLDGFSSVHTAWLCPLDPPTARPACLPAAALAAASQRGPNSSMSVRSDATDP